MQLGQKGYWIPSQGEEPTRYRSGKILLCCWNPVTKERAHLNVETDIFLSTEEYLQECP